MILLAAGAGAPTFADEIRGHGLVLEPRMSAGEDFQLGLRTGYGVHSWAGRRVSVFFDGEVRPYAQGITIPATPTFSYRYRETRWSYGPGISAGFSPKGGESVISYSAALGAAYTEGVFWGSGREPSAGWIGWGEVGFRYKWEEGAYWGMAVQVRPLPEMFPARVLLQFGFEFGKGFMP